ncbi:Las1-domain-containing protein [Lepidopterella palustris CBS 459.81]|uniref:Las1-domain-containing protein n=1 Tax=Lepidopterella palustris CBS 459.81 TaxID=1314670 RepID=A0A8E2DYQ4_9PEZI|nr:Las1-domain-containing protein [Lepidopterella palustris CBS 459.81]
MPRYMVTPWRNPSELLQLRRQLYRLGDFEHNDMRLDAVNQVIAWSARSAIPLALDSTIHLVEAMAQEDLKNISHFSLRLLYAAAISRFVTGICDAVQGKQHRQSMHDVAVEYDLPARLVEMRHEATHRDLPSLIRLKAIAEESLNWLWGWYWVKIDGLVGCPDDAQRQENLSALRQGLQATLKNYQRARRAEVKKSGAKSKRQSSRAGREASVACVKFCVDRIEYLEILTEFLVDEEYVIPSDRMMGNTMNGAFLLWDDLLRRLSSHQFAFLRILVRRMIDLMTKPNLLTVTAEPVREAMFEWIVHILTAKEWALSRKGVEVMLLEEVMGQCFTSPTPWTSRLAETLIKDRDALFRDTWQPILHAARATSHNEADNGNSVSPVEDGDGDETMTDAKQLHSNNSPWQMPARSPPPKFRSISRYRGGSASDSDSDLDLESESVSDQDTVPSSQKASVTKFRKRYKLGVNGKANNHPAALGAPGWKKWRGKWNRQPIGDFPTSSDCDG